VQLELATGAVFGLETLARWHHPRRGPVPPDLFVPAAERTGQAGPLFERMLHRSLSAQEQWAATLGVHLPVAVNLSPLQLREPNLLDSVARALATTAAPPGTVWLELTESALAEPSALATLSELHALGVQLALDDFGTGWSSMSRLAQVPCDVLKLDKTFVAGLGVEESADHLVRAMIVMAHALGIRTVAEGVETSQQLERLADLGCDVVQGYLISRPVTADRVAELVTPGGAWRGVSAVVSPS
jgi:diguanylate cyclase